MAPEGSPDYYDPNHRDLVELRERIARLEEAVKGHHAVSEIAARSLEDYKHYNNEWRQTLSDARSTFMTRSDVLLMITVASVLMGVMGFILKLVLR